MRNNQRKKLTKSLNLFILLFILVTVRVSAQNLIGQTTVEEGETEIYTYNDGTVRIYANWMISGGTVTSSSTSGTSYTATVIWGPAGSGTVAFTAKTNDLESLTVNIEPPYVAVADLNDIRTIIPRAASTNISTLSSSNKIESIVYHDGLCRPLQNVAIRAGGNSEDVITHIDYDGFGRKTKEYLPYSSTTAIGSYRPDALNETNSYYDDASYNDDFNGMGTSDINPYSETMLDNSPLNRVKEQAAPGKDWKIGNDHEIEFEYLANGINEVRLYEVNISKSVSGSTTTYIPTLVLSGYYPQNELFKNVIKDENHDRSSSKAHSIEEFKDRQGRVILKRTYGTSKVNGSTQINVAHDTYYVYDDYGNLTYVLPPNQNPDQQSQIVPNSANFAINTSMMTETAW